MSQVSTATLEADRDLSRRVSLFLSGRSQPVLRNLEVAANAGTVRLQGRVRSFYHRQLAVELTRRVAGVLRIVDELVVDDLSPTASAKGDAVGAPLDHAMLWPSPATAVSF